jgi:hypothetical protein
VVYAAVVRRYIVRVEKDAFLYCKHLACEHKYLKEEMVRLLKLVTGVDTSTRPERRSGSAGKTVNRSSLTAAAAPKRSNF